MLQYTRERESASERDQRSTCHRQNTHEEMGSLNHWLSRAGGAPPKIELTYDVHYGFLLTVMFQLDKKRSELDEDGASTQARVRQRKRGR